MGLKMVPNADDKHTLIPTNCAKNNAIRCASGTPTTTFIPVISEKKWCECPCPKINYITSFDDNVAEIKKTLRMEPRNFSTNTRKYVSVSDHRPCSKYIGSTAVIILIVTVALLIFPDLITLIKFI